MRWFSPTSSSPATSAALTAACSSLVDGSLSSPCPLHAALVHLSIHIRPARTAAARWACVYGGRVPRPPDLLCPLQGPQAPSRASESSTGLHEVAGVGAGALERPRGEANPFQRCAELASVLLFCEGFRCSILILPHPQADKDCQEVRLKWLVAWGPTPDLPLLPPSFLPPPPAVKATFATWRASPPSWCCSWWSRGAGEVWGRRESGPYLRGGACGAR